MSQFWTPLVQRLTPYIPGEQRSGENIVKLNTNENPYPPPRSVLAAISNVNGDALRRYPDPESKDLRASLAQYHGLKANQVMVGNGSDEILALAFMAFFSDDAGLQYPQISYSFYPVYCDLIGIQKKPIPLDANFEIELSSYAGDAGIAIPNPNAPTGIAIPLESVAKLCAKASDKVVLIDEAYIDFGAQSAIELIKNNPNLLVVQTFSKGRSLAGMRIGVAYGNEQLIEGLNRVKNSFNSYPLDVVAQAAAIASMADEASFQSSVSQVIATRTQTVTSLEQRGFKVLPSSANFVFASPVNVKSKAGAEDIFNFLSQQGVLVRYWNKSLLKDWLRISIGTNTEMDRFFSVLDSMT